MSRVYACTCKRAVVVFGVCSGLRCDWMSRTRMSLCFFLVARK